MARLTLDAVGKRAGLSKGAVFHHFRNKEDLAATIMREAVERILTRLDETRGDDRTPGAYLRAYLEATIDAISEHGGVNSLQVVGELARDPSLKSIFAEATAMMSEQIENDGIDPVEAQLIRLALDGLWFDTNTGGGAISREMRAKLIMRMLDRIK